MIMGALDFSSYSSSGSRRRALAREVPPPAGRFLAPATATLGLPPARATCLGPPAATATFLAAGLAAGDEFPSRFAFAFAMMSAADGLLSLAAGLPTERFALALAMMSAADGFAGSGFLTSGAGVAAAAAGFAAAGFGTTGFGTTGLAATGFGTVGLATTGFGAGATAFGAAGFATGFTGTTGLASLTTGFSGLIGLVILATGFSGTMGLATFGASGFFAATTPRSTGLAEFGRPLPLGFRSPSGAASGFSLAGVSLAGAVGATSCGAGAGGAAAAGASGSGGITTVPPHSVHFTLSAVTESGMPPKRWPHCSQLPMRSDILGSVVGWDEGRQGSSRRHGLE
ncbi:MAG: hypothetical protein COA70_07150 [Planctomycetota bacterium]|nr:MAG: hypothetical protein COA70_07150 [Planctomycetota bacterium]